MKSRWGEEEKETLQAIRNVAFFGNVLNLAAGDGRFNNEVLKFANVVACDINKEELELLKKQTPSNLKQKLSTTTCDITKLPFENNSFEGLFCTGVLHLFNHKTLEIIFNEINRVLKPGGKLVIDFACDIERINKSNNKPFKFESECGYSEKEAKVLLKQYLNKFKLNMETHSFCEDNSETPDGIKFVLQGKFLLVSGFKKE